VRGVGVAAVMRELRQRGTTRGRGADEACRRGRGPSRGRWPVTPRGSRDWWLGLRLTFGWEVHHQTEPLDAFEAWHRAFAPFLGLFTSPPEVRAHPHLPGRGHIPPDMGSRSDPTSEGLRAPFHRLTSGWEVTKESARLHSYGTFLPGVKGYGVVHRLGRARS
jgi:hypothetical protein